MLGWWTVARRTTEQHNGRTLRLTLSDVISFKDILYMSAQKSNWTMLHLYVKYVYYQNFKTVEPLNVTDAALSHI